ncbi:AraC family transcriptional regulator [Cohnella herbarum]|uniref:Helix-turn-helix domain-containing protein n=1 Tax=Cohnella herbarum TaxID=2728023 RepID=A0A7Z2VK44_9BACL|nr:AraC family transcriptional regulator [Cohnella herbarum]QJD84522.1 helix-turn-helix domain-containing protein [Cohnella herbarum]
MLKPIAVYFEQCDSGWGVTEALIQNHLLMVVTEGIMQYTIDGRTFVLRGGDAVYVPKGSLRSASHQLDQKHEMYVAHFHYEPDSVALPLLVEGTACHANISNEAYYKQRFSLLTQQWLGKNTYYDITCHYLLLELLTLLNIEITHKADPSSNNVVLQIQEYITRHYREKIGLPDLARFVNRTPSYISSVFRAVTGQTITEYTQQIRLAAARDLLTKSHMTIGEISNHLGFCEQSYFNKVFKKATGLPPSAFIKEYRYGLASPQGM